MPQLPPALLALVALAASSLIGLASPQVQETVEWSTGRILSATSEAGGRLDFEQSAGASLRIVGEAAEKDVWTIEVLSDVSPLTGVRIEALADPLFPGRGPGMGSTGNFVLSEVTVSERANKGAKVEEVPLRYCSSTFSQNGYAVTRAMDGDPSTGWAIQPQFGKDHSAVFELARSVQNVGGTVLVLRLEFAFGARHLPGHLRVSTTSSPDPARSVRTSQVDAALQQQIDQAVVRGVDFLLSTQELDGSWSAHSAGYPTGQTALSVFALAKAGLRAEHPAMRRGLEFLRSHPPIKTYSAGCHMMALGALARPQDQEWMEELTELMLSWKKDGGYAYPDGEVDISCSQYGALGLRAAAQYGIEIDPEIWEELAQDALRYQEQPSREPGNPAGYAYKPGGPITGSRTTAGLTMLAVAEEFLGDRDFDKPWRESKQQGLAWLGRNFTASANPEGKGGQEHWLYYYLYGVERVGSMLQTVTIGGSDWYRDGAHFLIGQQRPDGAWNRHGEQSDTCFALLFLTRGSGPTTGASSVGRRTYHAAAPVDGVELRASGDTPLNLWVSGFGAEVARLGWLAGEDQAEGLRVALVEYVGPEGIVLDDGRGEPARWAYRDRKPPRGWAFADFSDSSWDRGTGAFGLVGTPGMAVRTEWSTPELYLRKTLDLVPEDWHEPRLFLSFSDRRPTQVAGGFDGPLARLFDDEAAFKGVLTAGAGKVQLEQADVWSGSSALRVSPKAKENPNIPGWAFRITKKPKEGEFRYLHFAWKKFDEGGVMLQLAREGQWKQRYVAGKNSLGWEAESVDRRAPKRWSVVTCDLYADFGGEATLTGLSLVPMGGGEALFDGIYLGQKKSDFREIDPMSGRLIEASTVPEGPPNVVVYLNGEEIHRSYHVTEGYQEVADLSGLLLPGENVLSASVRRLSRDGQAFDLGVRARPLLGRAVGDTDRAWSGERFPIRATFPRPGRQRVHALATLIDPEGHLVTARSADLDIAITGFLDPVLLRYAGDATRNRLLDDGFLVEVSSQHDDGHAKAALTDGLLSGGWLCSEDDADPRVYIELDRGVRANRILITPTHWGSPALPFRLWVEVNGRGEEVEMNPDPLRKTVVDLRRAATVRTVEVRVIERRDTAPGEARVGFAEIELQEE